MASRSARSIAHVEALNPDDASHLAFMIYAIRKHIGDAASLRRIVDNLKTKKAKEIGKEILARNTNGTGTSSSKRRV
jgi:hypothetical protein